MASNGEESTASPTKIIDSHLHVWASPQETVAKYPYFPSQEPTLRGNLDFLLQCMEEAGVDGAFIVQPINHKFDHSYVTSSLLQFDLILTCGLLTKSADDKSSWEGNVFASRRTRDTSRVYVYEVAKFVVNRSSRKFCMILLFWDSTFTSERLKNYVENFPLLLNDEENATFCEILKSSRFPQIYVKFSALFRLSRTAFPYQDLSPLLSRVVSSFGANRVMWGSDFPFVTSECGYSGAKGVFSIPDQIALSSSEMERIKGGTASLPRCMAFP